jgi:hypothetical protein
LGSATLVTLCLRIALQIANHADENPMPLQYPERCRYLSEWEWHLLRHNASLFRTPSDQLGFESPYGTQMLPSDHVTRLQDPNL